MTKCGMVCVPVNHILDRDGVSHIINGSEAATLVFGEKYSEVVSSVSGGVGYHRKLHCYQ